MIPSAWMDNLGMKISGTVTPPYIKTVATRGATDDFFSTILEPSGSGDRPTGGWFSWLGCVGWWKPLQYALKKKVLKEILRIMQPRKTRRLQ